MNLSDLERQLEELQDRWGNGSKPIAQSIRKVRNKEIAAFWEVLCQYYLTTTQDQREQIRQLLAANSNFYNYTSLICIRESTDQLRSSRNHYWLRIGVAAASIDNFRLTDYRDMLLALEELYVAAEEAGIDPKQHFRDIALLSSNERKMRNMLAGFHNSAIMRTRRGEPFPGLRANIAELNDDQLSDLPIEEIAKEPLPWWKGLLGRKERP